MWGSGQGESDAMSGPLPNTSKFPCPRNEGGAKRGAEKQEPAPSHPRVPAIQYLLSPRAAPLPLLKSSESCFGSQIPPRASKMPT